MGYLLYGRPAEEIDIDDRALAHLKIVMLTKLRRGETFAFSFQYDVNDGSGRSTIWLHPAIPLQFKFLGSRQPTINRAWLEELVLAANSVDGLRILPEPEASTTPVSPAPLP
ncbi:MAG: ATP-dependent ligase [Glaciihabitans sp.]|nr:ATP-dependent ligase [Glaciihabitans sp.]MDQ1571127.1 hypothetical protein [Actinomycetota bacterium]